MKKERTKTKSEKIKSKNLIKLLNMLKPYRFITITGLFLLILGTVGDYITPLLLRGIIDKGIVGKDIALVVRLVLIMAAVVLTRSVAMYFQGYFMEKNGQKIAYDLRNKTYEHLQSLSFSYFDKQQTGQIMSKMTGDIECIRDFLGFGVINLIMCFINFIAAIAIYFIFSWKIALLVLIPVPITAIIIVLFSKKVNPAWEAIREQMGKLTTALQENIAGIRVVKAFAREPHENKKFATRNKGNYDENMKRVGLEAKAFPAIHMLGGLCFILFTWIGAYFVVDGQLTLGTFTALQWYIWALIWPIRFSGWLVNVMQQALAATPRVFDILETRPLVANPEKPLEMPEPTGQKGHIVFENINYNFPDGGPALKNINLDVRPGEIIAIIGGTGSGKSTMIGLIPRFFDPSEGRLTIEGIDIKKVTLGSLRSKIGIVMQETFLFSDTLRANISYGKPDADMQEIIAAAKRACIHDFIEELEQGYDSKVGERGIGLSGGQKQRIAIARAILRDPAILILDEATASVDTATERAIQASLKEIMKERTTFIIAQRLSTIKSAHRIIVMENGEIVEIGSHTELISKEGYYSKIYEMQFKGQELLETA